MSPSAFYRERLSVLGSQLHTLKQRKSAFAWLRLGSIAAIFVALYFLWSLGVIYVVIAVVMLLFIFTRLLLADLKNQSEIEHTLHLIRINENEIRSAGGDYYDFETGAEYITKEHPYSDDLDIFGRASLFQYISRAPSGPGSSRLADYLKAPASIEDIFKRQAAVKELSSKVAWIQDLQAFGMKNKITFSAIGRLQDWMKEPPVFSGFRPWKWMRYALPALILSIVALFIFDKAGESLLYTGLLVFAVIAYQVNKYVAPVHQKLSKVAGELSTLTHTIKAIELQNFESPLLKELQSVFLRQDQQASNDIRNIKKILDKLDLRYNLVLSLPLNLLLLWNLQQILDLEEWKKNLQHDFEAWFDAMAHFEALYSLGILYFNQPRWVFPEVRPEYFSIEGKEIGHPLIPEKKRVSNYIDLPSRGRLMLVTGSNMAGKSTYLRSIGVNTVLALAGAPVCAREFRVSHVQLISSMRIADNLEESTSTFYAELKKLKSIIEKVNAGEAVFILLDEILRGTNSLDRHTGSKALIRQLIRHESAAIIATHDLELAKLEEEHPGHISNYHFDVQVSNDELYFDYRLRPGVCNSLNASILMKKIGIDL